jgi:uncharacterized surface protein with fasciclin (FAS1) repeats
MNLTRFLSYMKHALMVSAMLAIVGISGCDDEDGPTVFNGTIMELINDTQFKQASGAAPDVALDSLYKYLSIYPDLVATLSGSTKLTLFAPSNSAFINLLALPGFPADIRQINPDIVKGVLSYHVVTGENAQNALTSGTTLSTAYTGTVNNPDDKISVNADGTLKTGSTNQAIVITDADNRATNGIVHVTATVLIPQTTGASLTPILGTMAGTILLGKDFTNLAKVILAADNGFTENASTGTFKVSTWLAMPLTGTTVTANQKGFTFFAPPNAVGTTAVFTTAIADALIASPDKGRSVLLNHLITTGQYTVANAPANNPNGITKFATGVLTPKSGKTITVSVSAASATNPYGVALTNNPSSAANFRPIVKADLPHSNGQVHVYAGLLQ